MISNIEYSKMCVTNKEFKWMTRKFLIINPFSKMAQQ